MMKIKVTKYLMKIRNSDNWSFYICGFLFVILFLYVPLTNDDLVLVKEYKNLSLADHWSLIVYDYLNWSSRVIVNFVVHVVLGQNKIFWVLINAIMAIILMKSLSVLFVRKNKKECNNFIACIVMMYPVSHLGSAGWLTTYTTYFWPIAIGFVALIPIKKFLNNERFRAWEYFIYSISLVYAANEELEMVVILFCYIVFLIYFICKKHIKVYFIIQFILSALSAIFTMTAPGNGNRGDKEIINWFQEYKMLNFIDKADIGFISTIYEIIFGSYSFFLVVCFLMVAIIWTKYQDNIFRVISMIPFSIALFFGPLQNITENMFDKIYGVKKPISKVGLVTVENYDKMEIFAQFFVLCITAVTFTLSIILILEKGNKTIFALALLISGTASRVAIGFSPTVWASGYRTYSAMFFAIIAIGVILYVKCVDDDILVERKRHYILYMSYIMVGLSYINAWYNVLPNIN